MRTDEQTNTDIATPIRVCVHFVQRTRVNAPHSVQQSPQEFNSWSAGHYTCIILLWSLKVKKLNHMNPVDILTIYLFKIHLNIFHLRLCLPSSLFVAGFSLNVCSISDFPHVFYISPPIPASSI
jgi:hypothetical protein